MFNFTYQIMVYVVGLFLGGVLVMAFGFWIGRSRYSRLRAKADQLQSDLTEERSRFALSNAEFSVTQAAQKKLLAAHAAELAGKEASHAAAIASLDNAHAAERTNHASELEKLKSRVAELEPLEARLCELTLSTATRDRDLAASHAESKDLLRQLSHLSQVNAELEARLSEHLDLIGRMTDQLGKHLNRNKELEAALAERDAELEAHRLTRNDGRIRKLMAHIQTLEPIAAQFTRLQADHNASVAAHQRALAEKDAKFEALRVHANDLEAMAAELEPLSAQLAEARAAVSEMATDHQTRLSGVLARTEELEGQVAWHRARVADFEQAIAQHKAVLETHARLLAERDARIEGLKTQLEASEINARTLSASVAEFSPQAVAPVPAPLVFAAAAGSPYFVPSPVVVHQASSSALAAGVDEYDETSNSGTELEPDKGDLIRYEPQPPRLSRILLSAKNAEISHLRETLHHLLGPVEPELVAPRAARMQTGSALEDWLRAEQEARAERLERYRQSLDRTQSLF